LMIGTDLTIQRMSSERGTAGRPGMLGAGH
jgi:hypothetical protein